MTTLTPREHEIMLAARVSVRYAAISKALGVSEHTVKHHLEHIRHKLLVHSSSQAVLRYFAEEPTE